VPVPGGKFRAGGPHRARPGGARVRDQKRGLLGVVPTGLVPVGRRFVSHEPPFHRDKPGGDDHSANLGSGNEPASHRDKPGGDVPGAQLVNRKRH